MIGIVVSRADHASTHIGEQLLDLADWSEHEDETRSDADGGGTYYRLEPAESADDRADDDSGSADGWIPSVPYEFREFEELHIYLDDPVPAFSSPDDVSLIVFVSRHSGNTGPLLTAHFTGNFGPAEFGGETGRFARAAPAAQRTILSAFDRYAPEGYDVGMECTHHGPTAVSAPSMFAEVGSDDEQWRDPAAARAVAKAVLSLGDRTDDRTGGSTRTDRPAGVPVDRTDDGETPRQIVGFGGGHYVPRFERIVRETPWGVGHIGADWALEAMGGPEAGREAIDRAFEASNADRAVVEGDRPGLERTIRKLGYEVVSETWLRTVGDRSLSVVDRLETELSTVEEGLRFGSIEVGDEPSRIEYVDLPTELLDAACGIHTDAAFAAVADHAIAFETAEGATRPAGRAAISGFDPEAESEGARAADSPYQSIVESLAAVLREKYDEVRVEEDRVVATTTGFDPALAADLGVPEGPAFGKLAGGQPVEIDGRTIDPDEVRSERRVEFAY